jgi:hypothetical protein
MASAGTQDAHGSRSLLEHLSMIAGAVVNHDLDLLQVLLHPLRLTGADVVNAFLALPQNTSPIRPDELAAALLHADAIATGLRVLTRAEWIRWEPGQSLASNYLLSIALGAPSAFANALPAGGLVPSSSACEFVTTCVLPWPERHAQFAAHATRHRAVFFGSRATPAWNAVLRAYAVRGATVSWSSAAIVMLLRSGLTPNVRGWYVLLATLALRYEGLPAASARVITDIVRVAHCARDLSCRAPAIMNLTGDPGDPVYDFVHRVVVEADERTLFDS